LHLWAASHGDRVPWLTPWEEGGTFYSSGSAPAPPWLGQQNRSYFQFTWISNELVSPKYLVCPADTDRRVALNWSPTDPLRGFRHSNLQDNALSYFVSPHAGAERPGFLLSGDRNFTYDSLSTSCSLGISPVRVIIPGWTVGAWQPTIHMTNGNLLLYDGQVRQVDSAGFRAAFVAYPLDDNGVEHFMVNQ